MAILQISQITQRKGYQADLPQLAGAEFGWSIDERRLWIGNGTLAEGAPVVGNTEILTEFSNIFAVLNYTYSGDGATGYSVTGAQPLSFQNWFDQYASVLDFDIVGDGSVDCTIALNDALAQIYSQPTQLGHQSEQSYRALFFPAGIYRIDGTLDIPSNAMLYGEGAENTILQFTGASGTFAAQTAAGSTGITIANMGFDCSLGLGGAIEIQSSSNTRFTNVSFNATGASDALIGFSGASAQTVFDNCDFTNALAAVNTDAAITGLEITNSYFNGLNQGIVLGSTAAAPGPTGVSISNNLFDSITAESILVGNGTDNTSLVTTGHNVFTNVTSPVIAFNDSSCVSVGDMFDTTTATFPYVSISASNIISTQGGEALSLGQYTQQTSTSATLVNNTTAALFAQDVTNSNAISFLYTISRGADVRTGTVRISSNGVGAVSLTDDYDDTGATGITFTATRVANILTVSYTTTNSGSAGTIQYSINYFA